MRALVVVLAVVVALSSALAWVSYLQAAHREERQDLELFLKSSSSGWVEVTQEFLKNSEHVAVLTARITQQIPAEESQLVALFADLVHTYPQIDAVYVAEADSSFLFVGTESEDSRELRSRSYTVLDNGDRIHEMVMIDAEKHVEVGRTRIEDDGFDPRERPWYQPAAAAVGSGHWSKPYTFASSGVPGVSYSYATQIKDTGEVYVFGVDIRISALARFLSEVRPGQLGKALLVDDEGVVIARYPQPRSGRDTKSQIELGDITDGLSYTRFAGTTQVVQKINPDIYLVLQANDEEFLGSVSGGIAMDALTTVAIAVTAGSVVGYLGFRLAKYRSSLVSEALTDPLTGLRSRRSIEKELGLRLERKGTVLSVSIIDLDRFKPINDTLGHHAGDYVLAEIGRRLAQYARTQNCVIGRLGGDEFVVLRNSELDGDALIKHLSQPIDWGGDQMLEVGASVGEVVVDVDSGHSVSEILQSADRALFEVKRSGRCAHLRTTEI